MYLTTANFSVITVYCVFLAEYASPVLTFELKFSFTITLEYVVNKIRNYRHLPSPSLGM